MAVFFRVFFLPSWIWKPWRIWTCASVAGLGHQAVWTRGPGLFQLLLRTVRATLHPLYIFMSFVSEFFDGFLLSWFFVHSRSYPIKTLVLKDALSLIGYSSLLLPRGIFLKMFCMFPSELTSSAWSNCLPSGDCCGRHKHRNRSNMLQVWICAGRSSDRNSVIKKGIIMIIIIIRVRTLTKIILKS